MTRYPTEYDRMADADHVGYDTPHKREQIALCRQALADSQAVVSEREARWEANRRAAEARKAGQTAPKPPQDAPEPPGTGVGGGPRVPEAAEGRTAACRYCGADCTDGRSWDGGDLYACPACADQRARVAP